MNLRINTIRVMLLAILVATPWFFGGVWARIQWVLMLLAGVLLALDLVDRFGDQRRPHPMPTLWLPLLAGIGLGLFQLVPLSPGVASWLAAGTLEWRHALLADRPESNSTRPESQSAPPETGEGLLGVRDDGRTARSLYTTVTREYLALLVLATAILVLASRHLIDRQLILWFCTALAICGALLCFFGLVQRLTWNGKFYWVFAPLSGGYESFGPFVNRNNAGGFLNLCLAAGLGLLVWVHGGPRDSVLRGVNHHGLSWSAVRSAVSSYVADLNAPTPLVVNAGWSDGGRSAVYSIAWLNPRAIRRVHGDSRRVGTVPWQPPLRSGFDGDVAGRVWLDGLGRADRVCEGTF